MQFVRYSRAVACLVERRNGVDVLHSVTLADETTAPVLDPGRGRGISRPIPSRSHGPQTQTKSSPLSDEGTKC
jgi:hypothetical protein